MLSFMVWRLDALMREHFARTNELLAAMQVEMNAKQQQEIFSERKMFSPRELDGIMQRQCTKLRLLADEWESLALNGKPTERDASIRDGLSHLRERTQGGVEAMSTPTPNEGIVISRPKAVADRSWWCEQPTREGFTKRAEGELPRMALSKFCRQQWDKATEGTEA